MSNRPSLDDYVDVAERVVAFKDKYPDGSLQTIDWSVVEVGDRAFIVYRAAAYRTPDDARPGHGTAWEPFPGLTPYTKNSELMNAETAAWGRAIVALGLVANRKLASRQEVRARAEEQTAAVPTQAPPEDKRLASDDHRDLIHAQANEAQLSPSVLANIVKLSWGSEPTLFDTDAEAARWLDHWLLKLPADLVGVVLENIAQQVVPVPA